MVRLWWDLDRGPGEPVVLLPEAARPVGAWPPVLLDGLRRAGRRVLRLDLRDQGRSPWVAPGYGLVDLAGDVVAVLGALGRPAHLVGWGLGGAVAVSVAASAPSLVAGLTLVGTSGWCVDPTLPGPEEPTAVLLVWRTRGGTAPEVLARALGREHRALCGPTDRPAAAAARAEARRWLDWGFNPHDAQRAAWLTAPPQWEDAARIGVPVQVVHGSDDPLVPLAHGERLAVAAAAPLRAVSGCGHELTPRLASAVVAAVGDGA